MSLEGITITLGEVSKTAGTVRSINTNLMVRLEEIKKEMNELSATWQSDASETIRANFNALAPKFENYREIVDAYAKFLDMTVESYNTAETTINTNAGAFK
ncbi:pore-forming ESAT-6 family protein [Bacillus alkalicellulosilyticus]|uniref:pore-forming ESAT-6 family protein n=1 Tax=Alkalihalobacterium alkalicellulosilyticum TaxID=1912214 RepID=UPI000996A852|nr:pore-forming ESAT-6 family protein [Bacillus alkalicellulosilyticus]